MREAKTQFFTVLNAELFAMIYDSGLELWESCRIYAVGLKDDGSTEHYMCEHDSGLMTVEDLSNPIIFADPEERLRMFEHVKDSDWRKKAD